MASGQTKVRKREKRSPAQQVQLPPRFRERAHRGHTILVDLYITLGKALIDGRRTVEGYWRIDDCFRVARQVRGPEVMPILVFSGFGGDKDAAAEQHTEASVFKADLEGILRGQGLSWPGIILTETEAKFTVENFLFSIRLVKGVLRRLGPRAAIQQVYVVSTDYHVQRLWDIDRYLLELSDIEPVRRLGREVIPVGAPYIYLTCADDCRRWLAQAYVQLHRLSLLQVNLQGLGGFQNETQKVEPETVGELRAVPFSTLPETIRVLEDLQRNVPTLPRKGPLKSKVEYARGELTGVITGLRTLDEGLRPHVDTPFNEKEMPLWQTSLTALNKILYPFRGAIDPDEPG